jgi:multisubunit Na+/H+ antiporter MnhB subunit
LGFGAGCIIGAFWNYIFLRGAAVDVWAFLTGRVIRPDVGLQLAATVAHFVLIVACAAGFLRLKPSANEWVKFLCAGILAIGYLLLLMITMRPEYIPLLKKCFGM